MSVLGNRGPLGSALLIAFVAACSSHAAPPKDDGEDTFRNICAKCHGQAGTGGQPLTPGGPAPRDFTDPVWQSSRSDSDLEQTVREGKNPMPAFKALLSASQIRGVISKVRRFRKER